MQIKCLSLTYAKYGITVSVPLHCVVMHPTEMAIIVGSDNQTNGSNSDHSPANRIYYFETRASCKVYFDWNRSVPIYIYVIFIETYSFRKEKMCIECSYSLNTFKYWIILYILSSTATILGKDSKSIQFVITIA